MAAVVVSNVSLMLFTFVKTVFTRVAMDEKGLIFPIVIPETNVNFTNAISKAFVAKVTVGISTLLSVFTINVSAVATGFSKLRIDMAPCLIEVIDATIVPAGKKASPTVVIFTEVIFHLCC